MNVDNKVKKDYFSILIENSYITSYVSILMLNKIISCHLRKKGILEIDDHTLREKYSKFESKFDRNYQEFIGSDTVNKFKKLTNPQLYSITNIKKTISYNSMRDILKYLRSGNDNCDSDDEDTNDSQSCNSEKTINE